MERVPSASQLLEAWEQARSQTQVQRAFTLLTLAASNASPDGLARLTVGQRDQELLSLRERIFGPRLTSVAKCPGCGQAVEVDFSVDDVRTEPARDAGQIHALQSFGYEVRFRLPNCEDLAALDPHADATARKTTLLRRCVIDARRRDEAGLADPLPESVVSDVSRRMAELDPQGEIQLNLTCPACGHRWDSPLDIVSYLWSEINGWAQRMLREVHAIASAYGWRESEILALSPWRRQAYLEMIRP